MKKLLPLLMAVLLVVAMAVPAFASSDYVLDGSYTFKKVPAFQEGFGGVVEFTFRSGISHALFYGTGMAYNDGVLVYSYSAYENLGEYIEEPGTLIAYQNGHWTSSLYTVVTFDNLALSQGEYQFFISLFAVCDSTSCPSTDANKDNICDDCGFVFAVLRNYEPFTVTKFMSNIGQILTFAVSWVSDVGAAIISQPLLLAFTALPLCGLGIAVFRRLKETV